MYGSTSGLTVEWSEYTSRSTLRDPLGREREADEEEEEGVAVEAVEVVASVEGWRGEEEEELTLVALRKCDSSASNVRLLPNSTPTSRRRGNVWCPAIIRVGVQTQ